MRWISAAVAALLLSAPATAFDAIEFPAERCGLYAYRAVITRVIDGDTVVADVDLGFSTWRRNEHLRLLGNDAPEVRGAERPAGLESEDRLRALVEGQEAIACTVKDRTGKYGRYLAELFVAQLRGQSVNAWMVSSGLASLYPTRERSILIGQGPALPRRRPARAK